MRSGTYVGLCAGLVLVLAAGPVCASGTVWWNSDDDRAGLQAALASYSTTTGTLNADRERTLRRTADWNDALHWIDRTRRIYGGADGGRYQIPVTEIHANGKRRLATFGRNGDFPTFTFLRAGESVRVTLGQGVATGIGCWASTGTDFNLENHIFNQVTLLPGVETTYRAERNGVLMLSCRDNDKKHPHAGKLIPVTVGHGGSNAPFFVFGVHDVNRWRDEFSRNPNPAGQVLMFNGRTRFMAPAAKALAAARSDIGRLMREHLDMTLVYDKLNGLRNGGDHRDLPTTGLINASYQGCCSASGGQGLVRIGFSGSPGTRTSWGDWHEYGHQYQMGWSWAGLTEVTVNLYSFAACRQLRAEPKISACHSNSQWAGMRWDHEATGTFLASGTRHAFDQMAGGTEFRRARMFGELFMTYDTLFPQLGREFRRVYDHANGAALFNTSAKRKDWFVVNASRFSGHDLRPYFEQWGLGFSQAASDAVAAMKLPLPIMSAYQRDVLLRSQGADAMVTGENRGSVALHSAMTAYGADQGPVALVWAGGSSATLTATVWDEKGNAHAMTLRGQRSSGACGRRSINSTVSCATGTTMFWRVNYVAADNTHLPAGRYTGTLHLAVRDWKLDEWGAAQRIQLDITR